MRRTILSTIAVLLAAAAAGPAAAASLLIPTRATPVISGAGTAFLDPFLGFGLLGDGHASSTLPAAGTDLLVTVPFADTASPPTGALFVTTSGPGQSFLSGNLRRTGFTIDAAGDDTLELLFGSLDGSAAAAFGSVVLLTLTGEFGADPIGHGFGSFASPVDVDMSVAAAVPLPAGLPLLLLGIAALFALRRRGAPWR